MTSVSLLPYRLRYYVEEAEGGDRERWMVLLNHLCWKRSMSRRPPVLRDPKSYLWDVLLLVARGKKITKTSRRRFVSDDVEVLVVCCGLVSYL